MMKDYSPNTNPSTVHIPKPRLNTSLRYSGDTSRGQEHKSNNNPYACSSQGHGLSWGLQCRITDWSAAHMEKNMERTHNQVNQVVIQVNTTYTCHTCPPMGVLFIKLHFGVAGAPGKWRYMAMPACLQTGSMIWKWGVQGSSMFEIHGQIWTAKITSNSPGVFPDPLQGHSVKNNKNMLRIELWECVCVCECVAFCLMKSRNANSL